MVAQHALNEGWDIKGVLNNDMISNISGIDGVIDNTTVRVFSEGTRATETPEEARLRRFTGGEVDSPSRNLARYVKAQADQYMTNLDVMMVYRLDRYRPVSYTHLRAHETLRYLVCRLLLEKKN